MACPVPLDATDGHHDEGHQTEQQEQDAHQQSWSLKRRRDQHDDDARLASDDQVEGPQTPLRPLSVTSRVVRRHRPHWPSVPFSGTERGKPKFKALVVSKLASLPPFALSTI